MCRRLTPGSLTRMSASVPRPTTVTGGCSGCCWSPATTKARARWAWVWEALDCTLARALLRIRNRPVVRSSAASNSIRIGPGELVALLLGVVLELLGEVAHHRGVVRREPVEVGLRELDVEVVGHHPPLARQDLGVVVALALERGGDLDRLHGAAERLGEGAGDHLLQLVLEALQPAHVRSPPSARARSSSVRTLPAMLSGPAPPSDSARPRAPQPSGRFGDGLRAGIACARFSREWRNRQTRTVQVRVSERTWGFNSPLAHVWSG